MSFQSGNTYVFVNVKGKTAADLSGGDNKPVSNLITFIFNRSIIGFEVHKRTNQQWTLEDAGDGQFFVKNGSGLYLSIEGDAQNGTPVIGSENKQPWRIVRDDRDPDHLRIFYPNSDFNLDLSDHGNPTPGTKVQLWEKTPGKGQTWLFESP